jgi:CheY-like chemotaxis protein
MSARILVAEDDEGVRSFVGTALKRAKYAVDFARDGAEAIEALKATDYDVIVLDLMMPKASGFEVLAWLQARNAEEARRKVVVLTAMAAKDLKNLTSDRVLAVLRKPFNLAEMLSTVARATQSRSE